MFKRPVSSQHVAVMDGLDDLAKHCSLVDATLRNPRFHNLNRDLDCVELFSGAATVATAAAGLGHASATFDKINHDLQNICTADGFKLALTLTMRIKKGGLLWAAPDCRSWGWMNSSNCKRLEENKWVGNLSYGPVKEGNVMATRTAFLVRLASHRGVRAAIENPAHSKIFMYLAKLGTDLGMHTVITYRCAFDDAAPGKRLLKPYEVLAAGCHVLDLKDSV